MYLNLNALKLLYKNIAYFLLFRLETWIRLKSAIELHIIHGVVYGIGEDAGTKSEFTCIC